MIAQGNNEKQQQIIIKNDTSNAAGIASFIFGLISIFFLAPLFVPLAVILGVIAIINKQLVWGILGLLCALFGFLTSPILLGIVGVASIAANQSHSITTVSQQQIQQTPFLQQQQQHHAEQIKKAGEEMKAAIEECKNKRLSGELKTYVESAKCSNPRIVEAYKNANYPYMDLIGLFTAKRLELAEKIDNHELTEDQAQFQLAKLITQITDKERQRNISGR